MNIDIVLSIVAALMHVVAYLKYQKQTISEISKPNLATWNLWAFASATNCISYIAMTGDIVKGFLSIASTGALIWVFLKTVIKYAYNDSWDKLIFRIGMTLILIAWVVVLWILFQKKNISATFVNLILQPSIVISFIPTFRGIWKNPETERRITPWFILALAYVFVSAVVLRRWEGQYKDLVYPINCFVLHLGVGMLIIIKNPERRFLK